MLDWRLLAGAVRDLRFVGPVGGRLFLVATLEAGGVDDGSDEK